MKNWNLESPAATVLLHAGLFAAVSAVVLFSEHSAPPALPPPVARQAAAPPPAPVARHAPPHLALPAAHHGVNALPEGLHLEGMAGLVGADCVAQPAGQRAAAGCHAAQPPGDTLVLYHGGNGLGVR